MPTFERTMTIQFQAFQYDATKEYEPQDIESYEVWDGIEADLPRFDVRDVVIEDIAPDIDDDEGTPNAKVLTVTRCYYDAFGFRNSEVHKLQDKEWLVEIGDGDYSVMNNGDFLKFGKLVVVD